MGMIDSALTPLCSSLAFHGVQELMSVLSFLGVIYVRVRDGLRTIRFFWFLPNSVLKDGTPRIRQGYEAT